MNNWKELFDYYKNVRPINKFVNLLMRKVSIDMIEIGRGKKTKVIDESKIFNEKLYYYTDYLINKFTFKEWVTILNADSFYKKESKNKDEDIRINLYNFLRKYYTEVYDIVNMPIYSKFQSKQLQDINKIIYVKDAYLKDEKSSGIYIIYNDNSRICYNNKTKERMIPELLEMKKETILVTLVNSEQTLLDKIKNIFFEEA